ncbi:carnitine dehydratase [Aeromicrobium sp. Root344]|uniref:CaiB/BaiF CoA transferase family protein n=1 Tax=Aeromicrobium sp. Root344 TaxID=1736521 RepID=UPI0006FB0242|nr:CoA transferase [Aeromicrobium sp. Root344]KQV75460.1 carnitine dehydratase [Aeromicrobium sp. Root344]
MTTLLDGIVVADFSRVLAGPLATSMLADLGATVVKVERPGTGDDTRHWGPPWTSTTSAYFDCANRSKQSVELDLDDPADHRIALDLMATADVVVENFRPGALAAKCLAYDDVRRSNPGVVYCSISGFGTAGGATLPGYDFLVQAVGGLMSITGGTDAEPTKVGVALVDVLTSKDAVIGILAALNERHASGEGQLVEVNLLSSLLGSLANQASSYLATGAAPQRMGNQHPSIAPYETLRCADGIIAVCCGNDAQFVRLAGVLGRPELAADERFAHNADRVTNRSQLVPLIEAVLAGGPAAEWITDLTEVGVPAGAVGDIGSAFDLATDLGLAPRVDVGPDAIDQVRHPITYSRTPVDTYRRPPRLGEHNDVVRARHTQKRTS